MDVSCDKIRNICIVGWTTLFVRSFFRSFPASCGSMSEDQDAYGKRMRELLSSFYGGESKDSGATPSRRDSLEAINLADFDVDLYLQSLLRQMQLDKVMQRQGDVQAEIKNLDGGIQMLVYENYNKFISATDTIRTMKENVAGMESSMAKLLEAVTAVRAKSDTVNSSLSERRERMEELNGTRSILRKVQFVFDLPQRLRKSLKADDHAAAVRHYLAALPVLQAYGKSSLQSCRQETEDILGSLKKRLQDQVMDSSLPVSTRAQSVCLLQQLNHPVESLIEAFVAAHWGRLLADLGVAKPTIVNKLKGFLGLEAGSASDLKREPSISPREALEKMEEAFINDFIETATMYRAIFPTGEKRLTEAAQKLFVEYFASVQKSLQIDTGTQSATELLACLELLSKDVSKLNELVPDAGLTERASKAVEAAIRQHIAAMYANLLDQIKAALVIPDQAFERDGESSVPPSTLRDCLVNCQSTIIQCSLDVLEDSKQLLDKSEEYLARWRDEYIDLVQAGFHNLFIKLHDHFQVVCGRSGRARNSLSLEKPNSAPLAPASTATPRLVLLLALVSVYIYQTAVPKITEVVGAWFIGGGAMGSEARPAFVPSEICRYFYAVGDRLIRQYVDVQNYKLVLLLRKSVGRPEWLKYSEVKDVRPVVHLVLQEVERIERESQQLLDTGHSRMHGERASSSRTGSFSSRSSARTDSFPIRQRRTSIAQRIKNKLLERDVAKLFSQRVVVFTKIEYSQASVLSAIVRLALKTFQECVRLETFNRNGFQQIQLDAHYLREPLRNLVETDAVVDTLLDEVTTAAAERCLDPVPLEAFAIEKILQKTIERKASISASSISTV